MDTLEPLLEARDTAREEGHEELADFCNRAIHLEGSLPMFAARAAIAELARAWLRHAGSEDLDNSAIDLAKNDIKRVIKELKSFLEEHDDPELYGKGPLTEEPSVFSYEADVYWVDAHERHRLLGTAVVEAKSQKEARKKALDRTWERGLDAPAVVELNETTQ
jgi:hypothetical protein